MEEIKESEDKCLYIEGTAIDNRVGRGFACSDYRDNIYNEELGLQIISDLDYGIYQNGVDCVDYIGFNEEYLMWLKKSGFNFNYIDPSIDPSEIESKMVSNILLAADIPDDLIDKIKANLSDTKKVYIRKIVDRSKMFPEESRHL